jgi:hypothetical protein
MKICNVGARKALVNQFEKDKAIDASGKILDMNTLKETDDRLKNRLKEQFGITRPIVDYNAIMDDTVAFSRDTFAEVDALHGIYYPENKMYQTDYTNDSTLTPLQLTNKYLIPSDNNVGATFTQPIEFTSEEVSKFKIGLSMAYPNLEAITAKSRVINGEQRYKIVLNNRPYQSTEIVPPPIFGTIDENKNLTEQIIVQNTIAPLLSKFKGATVTWVTPEEMQEILKANPKTLIADASSVNAVTIKKQVFLVKGKVTANTALEELMHLFVDKLVTDRKSLFIGLRNQALEQYPGLAIQLANEYSNERGFNQQTRDVELVTRAIRDSYVAIQNGKETSSNPFVTSIKQFLKWLKGLLNDTFGLSIDSIDELPLTSTLGEVAVFLDQNNILLSDLEVAEPRYNLTSKTDDYDSEAAMEVEAEKEGKTTKEIKLENNAEEIKRLKYYIKILKKNPANANMVASVQLLLENAKEYRQIIEDEIETVSTTKFVGNPLHDKGVAKLFQKYADFGTFLHDFMFQITIDALESGYTPLQILNNNPDYFHDFYEKNIDKIQIAGLSEKGKRLPKIREEVLSDHFINIVGIINDPFIKGNLVIPEVTIFERDSMDRIVVGRLDYLVIRKDGSGSIGDFKTTRSKFPMRNYSHAAIFKERYTTALQDGVHPAFERFSGRSKASIFLSQMGVYERLLKRIGIETSDNTIINIIYSPNESYLELDEEWVYENMYVAAVNIEGEEGLSLDLDEYGNPVPELSPMYKQVLRALSSSIIVEGETTEAEMEAKAKERINYISSIPEATLRTITDLLRENIDKQISQLEDEISDLHRNKADDTKKEEAKARKRLLLEARDWFSRKTIEDGVLKDLPKELVLKGLYDKTKEIISNLKKDSEEIAATLPAKKAVNTLGNRYYQLNDLKNFLEFFKSLLLKNPDINENSEIIADINKSIDSALIGQGVYIKIAGELFKEVILSIPKKNADEMMRQMELVYEMEVNKLRRIISGDASVLNKFTFYLGGKVQKIFGRKARTKVITNDMKEEAQKKLDKIEYFTSKKEFNRDFVDLYVENTFTNPESNFYIGSTVGETLGVTGDELRASLGNSELAISALAYYATNAMQEATIRFFDRMAKLNFDNYIREMTSKLGSYQAINNAISEKVIEKDYETGEEKEFMSFLLPYDYKVDAIQDEYDYAIKQLYDERKNIKKSDLPENAKKAELEKISDEIVRVKKEYTTWLVNNVETKLVPELYVLEAALPVDIQDRIDIINLEIDTIKSRNNNEDWMLDESSLLDIKRLESEIGLLKKEAILKNPELADIYDRMHKYYDYTVNEGKFDYARRQVLKIYPEGSEELKKWDERNSDLVADPKWTEELMALEEEKRNLFGGTDPILEDLYTARRKIMNKYKFNSVFSSKPIFNPLYMSDEDYEIFSDIENQINEYYSSAGEKKLDKTLKKELTRINKQLDAMRQTQNKPEYMRELNERIGEIIRINKQIGEEQNPAEKAKLQAQLDGKDIDFQKWYNRNNTAKYALGTIVKNGKVAAAPKRFNTVAMPTDPSRIMRVPNSKYRTRSYKPEAYNPNYSPSLRSKRYAAGNYAVPKGHRYNAEIGRFEIEVGAKWTNPRYIEMSKNKTVMDFYDRYVMDEYYNKQVGMSANKLGLFYPGVTQTAVDTIAQDGLEGAMREGREWVNNHILSNSSELDRASNEYGITGKQRVRFSHNYRLDTSLGTKDGVSAILKWGLQYEIYDAMEEANLALSPMIDFMKAAKSSVKNEVVSRQLDKVIGLAEFERNKFVYGQYQEKSGGENMLRTRKFLRQVTSLISFSRLAFDPAMQLGNLVSGNVQMFLSAQGEKYGMGTYKDWLFAKEHMYGRDGFMYNVIGDWGKIDNISMSTKILRYFNPAMNSFDKKLDVAGQSISKRLLVRALALGDLAYVIQDKGEMEISTSTLLKNLSAHKYYVYETNLDGSLKLDASNNPIFKKDDKGDLVQIKAYDALVDNGTMTPGIRSDVAMTIEDLESIRAKTQQEYLQHQGNYAKQNQTKFESGMIGTLAFFFRKYLVPFVENRFKGSLGIGDPKGWLSGQPQMGWWTATANIFRDAGAVQGLLSFLPEFISEKTGKVKINEFYKIKAAQRRREMLNGLIWTMAYVLFRGLVYDDDDKKAVDRLSWAEMQSLRVMAKVSNESRSMLYFPLIGKGDDFIKNFSTLTSAFNEGAVVFDAFENLVYYIGYEWFDSEFAYEMGYYQKKTFRYDEGTAKFIANLNKLTPLENVHDFIDPKAALKTAYQKKK